MPHRCRNPLTFIFIGVLLSVASAYLLAAATKLDAGKARELLRRVGHAELPKNQVRIKSVTPGITSRDAIVEAQLETAWRFEETKDGWQVAEVRLGDRNWESLELITEAVRREKIRRTTAQLQQLAEALEKYRQQSGSHLATDNVTEMFDRLIPRFLSGMPRVDWWGQPLNYRGTAASYQLISSGPDRQFQTSDDLIIENGTMKADGLRAP